MLMCGILKNLSHNSLILHVYVDMNSLLAYE